MFPTFTDSEHPIGNAGHRTTTAVNGTAGNNVSSAAVTSCILQECYPVAVAALLQFQEPVITEMETEGGCKRRLEKIT
jgi:hypothetical protein